MKHRLNPSMARRTGNSHKRRALALMASAYLGIAGVVAPPVLANDINVHPAACQAPFLNQAGPMRWHEYFLMNPANNVPTWVICPMTYDDDVVNFNNGGTFSVSLRGGKMDGASGGLPTCEFKVHSRDNLRQGVYIDRSPNRTFAQGLTSTTNGATWSASGTITRTDVSDDVGTGNQRYWGVSVVCLLQPGYSISWINMTD